MDYQDFFKAWDISASGLHGEWVRMQVIASNVANAETTQTPEGGPYRKRYVVFSTMMDEMEGVNVEGIHQSTEPPRSVYNPGHPDADPSGFVAMPNIQLPMEMVDMLAASRAYQANLAAMRNFRQVCDETLKLLR